MTAQKGKGSLTNPLNWKDRVPYPKAASHIAARGDLLP
jgi:hypothetical protein